MELIIFSSEFLAMKACDVEPRWNTSQLCDVNYCNCLKSQSMILRIWCMVVDDYLNVQHTVRYLVQCSIHIQTYLTHFGQFQIVLRFSNFVVFNIRKK